MMPPCLVCGVLNEWTSVRLAAYLAPIRVPGWWTLRARGAAVRSPRGELEAPDDQVTPPGAIPAAAGGTAGIRIPELRLVRSADLRLPSAPTLDRARRVSGLPSCGRNQGSRRMPRDVRLE